MSSLAICFYGQPRFIDNDVVSKFYTNLKSQYNADIYIHSWINDFETKMDASDWSTQYNFVEKQESAKQLLTMYNPIKFCFDKSKKFQLSQDTRNLVKDLSFYTENNENNLLSHLTSFSLCVKLIENPTQYDFLLITRFDAFLNMPDLNSLDSGKFYLFGNDHNHWTDIAFLCGNKYSCAFSVIDNMEELSKRVQLFTAEEYKKHNYFMHFSSDKPVWLNLGVKLVRSNDGLNKVQI